MDTYINYDELVNTLKDYTNKDEFYYLWSFMVDCRIRMGIKIETIAKILNIKNDDIRNFEDFMNFDYRISALYLFFCFSYDKDLTKMLVENCFE